MEKYLPVKKAAALFRELKGLQVPLYAANACCFLVMAAFPAMLLLPGFVSVDPAGLTAFVEGFLPEVFREPVKKLMDPGPDSAPSALGISAVTVLWSASRGMQGILTGLRAVYRREESRGWFYTRLVSMGYTLAFLAALPVTLAIHVFGGALLGLKWILPLVQTGIFTAMFMAVPGGGNGFLESLPGAVLASLGWLIFSEGYSLYATRFARLGGGYGAVQALALSVLWLYGCLCIFFWGGALNGVLQRRKNVTEP